MPFPSLLSLALGAKPLEPFGKGSNALKAGTRDAGPVGPTALWFAYVQEHALARPSVQPPAGVERNAPYTRPAEKGKVD